MGLADRNYMREESRGGPMSVTTILMIVLVAVYALQCINDVYIKSSLEWRLALTPDCFQKGWLWQLLTFQFLHASVWHLAGNLLVLWWAGNFVENILGKSRYLVALFGCGVMGGILQGLLMNFFPEHFGGVVVGASAGVSGLFAMFAFLERETTVRLYFVLPVKAIHLFWVSLAMALFFTLVPSPRESVAHAAHLGGLLAGAAWVKLGWHRDFVQLPWEGWFSGGRWQRNRDRKRGLIKVIRKPGWAGSQGVISADVPEAEFISQEVDPILDKISAQGIQSLTDREREILERARNKMAKR
ncbi:MAG: rhomboid family intramembrane serine protease [Akkermansiaceae bacterium]|nr:rhomboid family intramembrane serine protease [Verrucomicrobiales bacterium]